MQKLNFQQKLLQKLSPQQIQVIKLLEVPAMHLEQHIKKEVEENLVLETSKEQEDNEEELFQDDTKADNNTDNEEFSLEDYMNEEDYSPEDYPPYKYTTRNNSRNDKIPDTPLPAGETFHEYLKNQLGGVALSEKEVVMGKHIIGNIDEDGYLRRDLKSIADDMAFTFNITTTEEELSSILQDIQKFDPTGVGARNLRECLILQIEGKDRSKPEIKLALSVLNDAFDEFTRKHYDRISQKFNVSREVLKLSIDEILKLNPKPGGAFNSVESRNNQTIIPDFLLEPVNGKLELSLNKKNAPDLYVNRHYSNMLKAYQENRKNLTKQGKETALFVKQKIDSAKWFIDAIRQRQQTLLQVMRKIVDFQEEYFEEGEESLLKPMILKDIADQTGFDISTISRVSNGKYIQTHFGIFQLKSFFSESMRKDTGEKVSTRKIKKKLKECIEAEDKSNPLTDQSLVKILTEEGYPIARRTVAKYREQLNIPVARMRKEL